MNDTLLSNEELVEKARSVLRPGRIRNGFTVSEVGRALVTDKGNVYVGTNIDTCSGVRFCAEHSATAAMTTQGEYKVKRMVAVLAHGKVLPPCGRCRQLIHQIDDENLETEVVLGENRAVKLRTMQAMMSPRLTSFAPSSLVVCL